MTETPALRASDADRERAVVLLREHMVEGRLTLEEFADFGNIDLDLRQATLDGDAITIVALGAFGSIDVYVPEGFEVDLHGFALGGHRRVRGNEPAPRPGTPIVRVYALSIFAGIDVWRVPIAWAQRSWREVIRGIRSGANGQLATP